MKRNTFLMLLITWVVGFVTVFQWRIQDRAGNEEFSLTDDGRILVPIAAFTEKTCEPKQKIGFLKMHKCASTTLQNIFLRYAHINDLNVILPLRRWNYLGSPELFSLKLVNDTPWHHLGYDIMALHTRWDHSAVKQALGGDPIFVTIIREPEKRWMSIVCT
ncbi:galactosylceramide sulfotransferase-like isoform X2 [Artemia franciscana]|uniref:galactosylceramide sulfotransferase-like isoform X2 n=1 Tax=Artemia franciscana TaxID=6661 RepID=UPI0032D9C7ED